MRRASAAPLAADTAADLQGVQVELWRRMPPLEKAQAVARVSRRVRQLSLSGLRRRYPSATEQECRLRYALLTLGRSLACRAYPEASPLADR